MVVPVSLLFSIYRYCSLFNTFMPQNYRRHRCPSNSRKSMCPFEHKVRGLFLLIIIWHKYFSFLSVNSQMFIPASKSTMFRTASLNFPSTISLTLSTLVPMSALVPMKIQPFQLKLVMPLIWTTLLHLMRDQTYQINHVRIMGLGNEVS